MQKREKKLYRACAVLLSFLVAMFALVGGILIANALVDRTARYVPDYEKADLAPILAKAELTDGDYDTLYRQTGLTKLGVEAVLSNLVNTETPLSRLCEYQNAFFYRGKIRHEEVTPFTQRDCFDDPAPVVPLKAGDVLITSGTHTIGWRHGHAAIVVDEFGTTLESICYGVPSATTASGFSYFAECASFMVLRLKDTDDATRAEIAAAANRDLRDIPYALTVGVFSKKNQTGKSKKTQCGHLVWQAFKNFGYDIDANGGAVAAPRDLARSPLFEVVQIYGFDPDKLW